MITAAIALAVDVVAVVLLLLFTDLGIYSLLVAMIIYAVVVCILNDIAMKKYLQYKNPWKYAYLNPILASVPMCAAAGLVYYGLYSLIHSNAVCLVVAVVFAAAVYFLAYIFLEGPSREKLSRMPGGTYLVRIADKVFRK